MAPQPKLKGVVLAAGLGTRLLPLTQAWPKPLVPFLGSSALELALWRLKNACIDNVAINAHYLSEQFIHATSHSLFNQSLHVSYEPTLLGTGGVYGPLKKWRDGHDLLILNGDIISNINITQLIHHHIATKSVATMVLLPHVIPGESAVWHKDGRVYAIGRDPVEGLLSGNFACAQILSSKLLNRLPETGAFDIISKGYKVALDSGETVSCILHQGLWHDLRTPQYYWEAIKDCLRHLASDPGDSLGLRHIRGLRQMPTDVRSDYVLSDLSGFDRRQGLELGPWTVIENGSKIGENCHVRESLILPGAVLPPGSHVSRRILGHGIDIPLA
jgi:NDP-sugar pyrophosphorylase family protein